MAVGRAEHTRSELADRVRASARTPTFDEREIKEKFEQTAELTRDLTDFMSELSESYDSDSALTAVDAMTALDLARRTVKGLLHDTAAATESLAAQQKKLQAEVSALDRRIADGQSVERSVFDQIAGAVVRIALSTLLGAAVGGPLIAFVLSDPFTSKIIEGALGGFVGGVASEVGPTISRPLDARYRPGPSRP